jgi:hypothetical protein
MTPVSVRAQVPPEDCRTLANGSEATDFKLRVGYSAAFCVANAQDSIWVARVTCGLGFRFCSLRKYLFLVGKYSFLVGDNGVELFLIRKDLLLV